MNVYNYNDELIQNSKFGFVKEKIDKYLGVDNSSQEQTVVQEDNS
ncbi:MAG: hypothetical protein PHN56_05250 [Candidatus Nanoarchaeia archaeon]|nr:hypothetical protein [Candidatus Nanoarchaeia archaeon]